MKIRNIVAIIVGIVNMAQMTAIPAITHAKEEYGKVYIDEGFDNGEFTSTPILDNGAGEIIIEQYNEEYRLALKTEYDGAATRVSWSVGEVSSGVFVASLDFIQPTVKSSNNTIVALANGNESLITVKTNEGNLELIADSASKMLVEDYDVDTVYNIKITCDYDSGNAQIYVNNNIEAEVPFNCSSISTVFSESQSYPGIIIDNIYAQNTMNINSIVLNGKQQISIPLQGIREYTYSVSYTDATGTKIDESDIIWTVIGEKVGITESANGETLKLSVTSEAVEGEITIKAALSKAPDIFGSMTVKLSYSNAASLKIKGDSHISSNGKEPFRFKYEAILYDAAGNEMNGESFSWDIADNPTDAIISMDDNGVLTISGSMPQHDMYVTIKAISDTDPNITAVKKLVVQKYDVYLCDMARLYAAKDSIDFILKYASNENKTNPLIAAYLSPYTKKPGAIIQINTGAEVYADLSTNFELFRSMTGLSNMFDNESYRKRVYDMYQWYLDYGRSKGDLFYMGNHQVFDLATGRRSEQHATYNSYQYMEIEDRDFYSQPFLDLDKEVYVKFCQAFWANCIADWSTLVFNRHTNMTDSATNYSVLENLAAYDEHAQDTEQFIPFIGLTFMSTGNILLKTASDAYLYGDPNDVKNEALKIWAYRFIRRYMDSKNPETGMFGTMFVSSHKSPNKRDIVAVYGDRWWETEEGVEAGKSYNYGDRAYNQFAQTCVDTGRITADRMDEILEAALINNDRNFSRFAWECYEFADKVLGLDTPEGRGVAVDYTRCIKNIIENAYNPETNKFRTIFSNGVDITDMQFQRRGYFGRVGTKFGEWDLGDTAILSLIKAYETTEDLDELAEDREYIWNFIKTYLDKKFSIGDIGNPTTGEKPDLKMNVNTSNTGLVRVLISFYDQTGWEDYLHLARIIGNNIVKKTYKHNMFITKNKLRYIATEAESQYVLLLIEEAIRQDGDLLPDSSYTNAYEYQLDSISQVNGEYLTWTNPELLTWEYRDVLVKEIKTNVTELRLHVGDTVPIELTIKPDDATSKGLFWEIDNKSIVSINEKNQVTALSSGETTVIAISKSSKDVESKPIRIIVE